jgi:hypothetical protein
VILGEQTVPTVHLYPDTKFSRSRLPLGSILFRTPLVGVVCSGHFTPPPPRHAPRRGPENFLQLKSGEIRKFT